LITCFAAVAVSFAASTFLAEYGGFRIRRAARTIATDSAPSQRHLGVMRTDLRNLLAIAYRCASNAPADDPCRLAPAAVLADLNEHWATYLRLPAFGGETELWPATEAKLRALHEAVPDPFPAGRGSKLIAQIDSRIETLDASLVALVQLNLTNEDRLSAEIQTLGRQMGTLALAMDVVGFLFAAGMAFIALRIVQRYTLKREETLNVLSLRDELTGLYNRRGLFRKAIEQIDGARRNKQRLLLVFADLDELKAINDRFGHATGDRALVETATLLRQTFRVSDVIARLGGDEFVALSLADGDELAESLRERLAENLARHNSRPDRPFHLGISIGMAWYEPETSETLERLLKRADSAMYREKRLRRGGEFTPRTASEP
jgi:diguanylate cyclase (GGDEF)-like protein